MKNLEEAAERCRKFVTDYDFTTQQPFLTFLTELRDVLKGTEALMREKEEAVLKEREMCARVVEMVDVPMYRGDRDKIANAIRNRTNAQPDTH